MVVGPWWPMTMLPGVAVATQIPKGEMIGEDLVVEF